MVVRNQAFILSRIGEDETTVGELVDLRPLSSEEVIAILEAALGSGRIWIVEQER